MSLHITFDSFICVPWLISRVSWPIHVCVMTHSYVWHDSFTRVTWLIHTCDMTLWCTCPDMTRSYMWHDSFIHVTWLIHTCDMTHSRDWHDTFIRVTWLIRTRHNELLHAIRHFVAVCCNVLREWNKSFTQVTRLIYTGDMTHWFIPVTSSSFMRSATLLRGFSWCTVGRSSAHCINESRHINQWVMPHVWARHVTYQWVMWHIRMRLITRVNEVCRIWGSWVGSLKL